MGYLQITNKDFAKKKWGGGMQKTKLSFSKS